MLERQVFSYHVRNLSLLVTGSTDGKQFSDTTGNFPGEYIPNIYETYASEIMIEGQFVHFELWDSTGTLPNISSFFLFALVDMSSGDQKFKEVRPLNYMDVDVFILCFSLFSHSSMENARDNVILSPNAAFGT